MIQLRELDRIPARYWRAALAEVSLLHPQVQPNSRPVEIGSSESGWRITAATPDVPAWVAAQFSASKSQRDGSASKVIPFVLIPARLSENVSHGVKSQAASSHVGLSIICIPCLLDRDGGIRPDPERDPWIPRDLLEPTLKSTTIGSLEDHDKFVGNLPEKPEFFDEVLQFAADLFRSVTGSRLPLLACGGESDDEPPLFAQDGFGLVSEWHGIPYEPPVVAKHLIKLYDQIVQEEAELPLFDNLCTTTERPAMRPLELTQAEQLHSIIVGHINKTYPLSPSQREAMVELARLKDGQLLTVNGPPGTGKTTLLQSVVAQVWVNAALRGSECPLIVVTSTNVKAVENVLDCFGKIAAEMRHVRWHPYSGGFGIFFASEGRETKYPTCTAKNHPYTEHESDNGVAAVERYFLLKATEYFGQGQSSVDQVVDGLRNRLHECERKIRALVAERYELFRLTGQNAQEGAKTGCVRLLTHYRIQIDDATRRIQDAVQELKACDDELQKLKREHEVAMRVIDSAEQNWNSYIASSPLWLDLLSFLPPVRRRRRARDRSFLMSNPLTADLSERGELVDQKFAALRQAEVSRARAADDAVEKRRAEVDERRNAAVQDLQTARQSWASIDKTFRRWSALVCNELEPMLDVSLEKLNDQIDLILRAPMFCLADWYWTGKWLLEMKTRLANGQTDTKGRAKLEAKYRRFAKLSPCIVSNFHMAPNFFTAWQGEDIPLWNTIDLLIVDESGQVSPDVGAPMFALARRALVVGDIFQIEPVWNNGETTDRANAVKFDLISTARDTRYDQLAEAGYAPASGSLMRIANRSCEIQKYPDLRGLMLTEHRRCVPEIVGYCNELIYSGRLEPRRPGIEIGKRVLPAFGYYRVSSEDKRVGSSRQNPGEAASIVAWLKASREMIERHYLDENGARTPIWRLVGIITPFSAQARAIERELKKQIPELMRKESRMIVGTVHALQGAERSIVIFSSTYGSSYTGGTFFDQKPNMLNVAVSRAKDSFLVFGNLALFDAKFRSRPSGLLATYLMGNAGREVV